MLRLSKLTDYAVVLLGEMARHPGLMQTTPELAQATGIPLPTVEKLSKILSRAGLVRSQRGANGGYRLARDPRQVSVADVITAVDGPIILTECVDSDGAGCVAIAGCPMRGNWDRVNTAVRAALASVSLEEMTQPTTMPFAGTNSYPAWCGMAATTGAGDILQKESGNAGVD